MGKLLLCKENQTNQYCIRITNGKLSRFKSFNPGIIILHEFECSNPILMKSAVLNQFTRLGENKQKCIIEIKNVDLAIDKIQKIINESTNSETGKLLLCFSTHNNKYSIRTTFTGLKKFKQVNPHFDIIEVFDCSNPYLIKTIVIKQFPMDDDTGYHNYIKLTDVNETIKKIKEVIDQQNRLGLKRKFDTIATAIDSTIDTAIDTEMDTDMVAQDQGIIDDQTSETSKKQIEEVAVPAIIVNSEDEMLRASHIGIQFEQITGQQFQLPMYSYYPYYTMPQYTFPYCLSPQYTFY